MYAIFFNFRVKRFFLSKKKTQLWSSSRSSDRDDPGDPVAAPTTPWQLRNPVATLLIFFTKKETVMDGVCDLFFVFFYLPRYQLWSEALSSFFWEMNMKV